MAKKKKRKKRKIKDHEIDMGERGIYNKKNPLNDMTGKEWIYFTNSIHETDYAADPDELDLYKYLQDSVLPTRYSTNGEESFAHNLRKAHPSPKPPQLMRDILSFFTKKNEWVLDPFMGVGGTLLGASLANRNAVGIDLSKEYIDIYKKASKQEGLKLQTAIKGDARNVAKYKKSKDTQYDLILTDPPYANMMAKKRTGGDKKSKGIGVATPFTENKKDIGNLTYKEFLPELRSILEDSVALLKNKRYLVVFCKDLQPTKEHHNLLHADVVSELSKISELQFKGYKIWYDKTLNLFPYGYPYSFVANQLHQYILVFRKEA